MNAQSPQMLILQNQEEQEEEIHLKDYWAVFKRRRWLILAAFFALVSLTVAYLFVAPRRYEATAVVSIPASSTGSGLAAALGNFLPIGSNSDVATEIEIIRGRNIAEKAISKLGLGKKDKNREQDPRRIVLEFQKSLKVKQRGRTNLIDITATGGSAEEAMNIANQVAAEYVQMSDSSGKRIWSNLIGQMEKELVKAKSDMEKSKLLLHDYEAEEGITPAFGPLLMGSGQLTGSSYVASDIPKAVATLKASIIEMEIQLEALRRSFSEGDPKVISLKNQIAESKRKLQQEEQEAIEKYNKQFGLTRIASEVLFNQQLYGLLVAKQEELKAQYIMQHRSPEVIENAMEPLYPSSPRRKLSLMLGAALGMFLGLSLALLREYMDKSMHAAEDVSRSVDLPVLGLIPRFNVSSPRLVGRGKDHPRRSALIDSRAVSPQKERDREFYKESYIILQLELMASANGKLEPATGKQHDGLTLLVTSSVAGEGKSVIAADLAASIAQTGKKVLLVDADCRNSVQHEILELDAQKGLIDMLTENAAWDDVVKNTSLENLHVITSGIGSDQPDNISKLFITPLMESFVSLVRKNFDVIIFDSPPVTTASDSAVVGSKVDGVVLVIGADDTQRDVILQAKQRIESSGGNILGVVLNFGNS
jgi:succinoglycan biosynthesis transport protein ExoP